MLKINSERSKRSLSILVLLRKLESYCGISDVVVVVVVVVVAVVVVVVVVVVVAGNVRKIVDVLSDTFPKETFFIIMNHY